MASDAGRGKVVEGDRTSVFLVLLVRLLWTRVVDRVVCCIFSYKFILRTYSITLRYNMTQFCVRVIFRIHPTICDSNRSWQLLGCLNPVIFRQAMRRPTIILRLPFLLPPHSAPR